MLGGGGCGIRVAITVACGRPGHTQNKRPLSKLMLKRVNAFSCACVHAYRRRRLDNLSQPSLAAPLSKEACAAWLRSNSAGSDYYPTRIRPQLDQSLRCLQDDNGSYTSCADIAAPVRYVEPSVPKTPTCTAGVKGPLTLGTPI